MDDIDACTFAGYLMNEHGIDPISFGVTLAAAMELFEMGVITTEDTDGVSLNFGNAVSARKRIEYSGALIDVVGPLLNGPVLRTEERTLSWGRSKSCARQKSRDHAPAAIKTEDVRIVLFKPCFGGHRSP